MNPKPHLVLTKKQVQEVHWGYYNVIRICHTHNCVLKISVHKFISQFNLLSNLCVAFLYAHA